MFYPVGPVWSGRLPVTEEITGSSPVQGAMDKQECRHRLSGSQKFCGCPAVWEVSFSPTPFDGIYVCDLHVTSELDKNGPNMVYYMDDRVRECGSMDSTTPSSED